MIISVYINKIRYIAIKNNVKLIKFWNQSSDLCCNWNVNSTHVILYSLFMWLKGTKQTLRHKILRIILTNKEIQPNLCKKIKVFQCQ